jgi:hypothetical protein
MTKDDIIRMAREAGFERTKMHGALERFAYIVAAAEREACALLCDKISDEDGFEGGYAGYCADMIRARGQSEIS